VLETPEERVSPAAGPSTALDHAELEQISYWKPRTAGELIFNYWD
jgi:hypothetical protein